VLLQVRLIGRIRHLHRQRDDVKKLVHLLVEATRLEPYHFVELDQHLHVVGKRLRDPLVRRIPFAAAFRHLIGEITRGH
jgi:hypothetical protein